MKSGVIPTVILVTVLAAVLPFSQGLQCYFCQPEQAAGGHKNCKGGSLPDSLLQTCEGRNSENPFFLQHNIGTAWNGSFACSKSTYESLGIAYVHKACIIVPDGHTNVGNCSAPRKGPEGVSTVCHCYGDKCNGAPGLGLPALQTLLSVAVPTLLFKI